MLVAGNQYFTADLYRAVGEEKKGNFVLSPSSIREALAMTYAGAEGDTARQMRGALAFHAPSTEIAQAYASLRKELEGRNRALNFKTGKRDLPAYEYVCANSLWPATDLGMKDAFRAQMTRGFGALLTPLDFRQPEAARRTINDWVAKKTRAKIQELIPKGDIDAGTRLVLTNAIYLKAAWKTPFRTHATKAEVFHAADGDVEVSMMHGMGKMPYLDFEDKQIVAVPYLGDRLDMVLVVPKAKDGLAAIEAELSGEGIAGWFTGLATQKEPVHIGLPKFKLRSPLPLKDVLIGLGMPRAFSGAAEFGRMATEPLMISKVIHEAVIDVHEKGTEAAAATAVIMKRGGIAMDHQREVTIDRPFLFFIREVESGQILFAGRCSKP